MENLKFDVHNNMMRYNINFGVVRNSIGQRAIWNPLIELTHTHTLVRSESKTCNLIDTPNRFTPFTQDSAATTTPIDSSQSILTGEQRRTIGHKALAPPTRNHLFRHNFYSFWLIMRTLFVILFCAALHVQF